MDNIENENSHTVLPHGNVSQHFKNTSIINTDAEDTKHRHCVSLPLYYDQVNKLYPSL